MVQTGLEVLLQERLSVLRGCRVGVLCHPASVDRRFVHVVDALLSASVNLTRLFGPEHGVRGEAQDMVGIDSARDLRTGIAVESLYGDRPESLSPSARSLADIDV